MQCVALTLYFHLIFFLIKIKYQFKLHFDLSAFDFFLCYIFFCKTLFLAKLILIDKIKQNNLDK